MTKLAKKLFTTLLVVVCPLLSFTQGTSNKGTDFWIGYMGHIDGTGSAMKLYVTSDVSTTGTVSVPGQSWSQNFSVTANAVTVLNIPPTSAYIGCDDCTENKGIHLVSVQPVVVYSHIHANARSDATLILPTATLGREYLAMSYTQKAQSATQRNQFMVLATEDSTLLNITPTVASVSGFRAAGQTFSLMLNKGEAYQFRSATDVTGSHVISVASSSGSCKRIAVFSGSSFTQLGCTNSNSGDNLYQQMYPISSWGKNFITVPMKTRQGGDYFRVMASKNNTRISINSAYITTLQRGDYYEYLSAQVNFVSATEPVLMAQFQRTQNCDNVTGDPSMTILTPIEQGLNDITLYSSPFQNIVNHHINVVMPRSDTASFRLDGNKVVWGTVTSNYNYCYTQTTVGSGNHSLTADSSFNAIAYGFGNVESYGYAAGANIKNLSHFVSVVSNTSGTVCSGVPTKFRVNTNYTPSAYKWYVADTFYTDSAEPVITFDTLATIKMAAVTYNANQNDCESKDSSALSITVRPQPTAKFTVPHTCLSDTISLNDSSTVNGPAPITKWRWDFGDGTFNIVQHVKKKYDSAYVHKVRLIVTTISGCADTITKELPVYPQPKTGFTFSNVCYLDTAVFTDTSKIDSTNIVNYIWDFGDGQSSFNRNDKHNYPFADTFSVELRTVSDEGCTDSVTKKIIVHPRPVAGIQTYDICQGDTTVLKDVTLLSTDTIATRQWWEGSIFIDTAKNKKWLPADTGLHKVLLYVKNTFGCEDTATATVDVFSNPVSGFTVDDICYTDSAKFIDKAHIDEGEIRYWTWGFGDGAGDLTQSPSHIYAVPGYYTLMQVVESDRGCKDTTTGDINVYDIPEVNFDINDVCVYDTATFFDYSAIRHGTQTARFWEIGATHTDTATAPRYKFDTYGSYKVKLGVEVSNLCFAELERIITIYPKPKSDFSFKEECVKLPVTFNDHSTVNFGYIILRDWDLGTKTDTGMQVTNTYFTEGKRPIRLITESEFGCRDTLVKILTTHPKPDVNFNAPEVCLRETMRFYDSVTVPSGYIKTYSWDYDDRYYDTGQFVGHVYNNWGYYDVLLVATTDKNCVDSVRKQVHIAPLPRARLAVNDTDGCSPFEVFFEDVSQVGEGGIARRQWLFGDGKADTLPKTSHIYKIAGKYTPGLQVITDKGCRHDSTFFNFLTVYDPPKAGFSVKPDSVSYFTPTIAMTNTASSDVVSWHWQLGDGNASFDSDPVHDYPDTGRYRIRQVVINNYNCLDTAYGKVFISPDYTFFIPNAFTPGAGELNPSFGPSGIYKGITDFKMEIFTRWGEKVFETDNILVHWDGKYKEEPAETGVYVYQITILDYFHNKKNFRGTLLLLR